MTKAKAKEETYTMEPDGSNYVIKLGKFQKIASITFTTWREDGYWHILTYAEIAIILPDHRLKFPTKEAAFDWITTVHKTLMHHINTRPLPEDAMRFFEGQASALREKTAALISQLYQVQREKYELLQLARKFGVSEATHYIDDSDIGEAVKGVVEFSISHKPQGEKDYRDIPFFSEAVLYDLIGKDAARSVLGRLNTLIKLINPEVSLRI